MEKNKDKFLCIICNQLYQNPVVHESCGNSFDRHYVGTVCPAEGCDQVINENNLMANYSLLQIVVEYRLNVELPSTYYRIHLNRSTSI